MALPSNGLPVDFGCPRVVLVLSGKRKSGKDYVTDILKERLGCNTCVIVRLSAPLKRQYAKEHNLDYTKLLGTSEYKEIFRLRMISWGEAKRNADPGFFCRHALLESKANEKLVWIISDARRRSDVDFFLKHFPAATKTARLRATEGTRAERKWKFTNGVDDAESECGLDEYDNWDFVIDNNGDNEVKENLKPIFDMINEELYSAKSLAGQEHLSL